MGVFHCPRCTSIAIAVAHTRLPWPRCIVCDEYLEPVEGDMLGLEAAVWRAFTRATRPAPAP